MINDLKSKFINIIERKKILGLVVEEKCLLAADMQYDGEIFHVKSSASLVLPENSSIDKSEEIGALLKQFLKENGFKSKKVVIGIPAKWFMMKEKTVPPSTIDSVAGMLKIQAEREFSTGAEELLIDYTGHVSQEKSSSLFLGAVRRKKFENVLEIARTAGLRVLSITPASIALRTMIKGQINQIFPYYFLYIRPGFAEMLEGENEQVTSVKHIPMDSLSEMGQFVSDIKRIISLHSNQGREATKKTLMVWDSSNLDDQELSELKNSLLSHVDIPEGDALNINSKMRFSSGKNDEFLIAETLGQAFIEGGSYYLDFCNSRMDVKNSIVKRKHIAWASAVILVLIIFLLNMVYTWNSDKKDVMALKSRLEEMSEDIRSAQDVIERVTLARGWYSDRPEILPCLRELTLAFPVEGRVWATNLAINENMKGIVSGKAVDEKSVIEVLDNLKDNNMFSNTQMIYIRENGQTSQEVSFSMSFSFKGRGL
ncbi:PilN domain-containing protein [Thermodesulfobacteriota bacterium]